MRLRHGLAAMTEDGTRASSRSDARPSELIRELTEGLMAMWRAGHREWVVVWLRGACFSVRVVARARGVVE